MKKSFSNIMTQTFIETNIFQILVAVSMAACFIALAVSLYNIHRLNSIRNNIHRLNSIRNNNSVWNNIHRLNSIRNNNSVWNNNSIRNNNSGNHDEKSKKVSIAAAIFSGIFLIIIVIIAFNIAGKSRCLEMSRNQPQPEVGTAKDLAELFKD